MTKLIRYKYKDTELNQNIMWVQFKVITNDLIGKDKEFYIGAELASKSDNYFDKYFIELDRYLNLGWIEDTALKEIKEHECYMIAPEPKILKEKPQEKIDVQLPGNDRYVGAVAQEMGNILKNRNAFFYKSEEKNVVELRKIKIDDKQTFLGFTVLKDKRFVTKLEEYIRPYNEITTRNGVYTHYRSISPTHAGIIIESPQFQEQLKNIKRIFTIPIPIIYNGELNFPKKGYDERFESWLPYDSPIISNPKMPLKEAKEWIDNIFKEFCFEKPQDKTNAIALLLTPFLRGLYPNFNDRTPVGFYIGNRERCGKDYCAGITGIVYEGFPYEETPISTGGKSDNDELRKKLLSAYRSGRQRLHFSNNKGFINNSIFEQTITSKHYSDRVLGRNDILRFSNEMEFSLSGNSGITYTADLGNRSIFVNLFFAEEDANARKFKTPQLHQWVNNNRENILSALYSLVKNWIDKKKPESSSKFASFPEWASTCGGIMAAAKLGDPCKRDISTLNVGGDKETTDIKTLFEACYETHKNNWITKNQIIDVVNANSLFPFLKLEEISGKIKFSLILRKFIGRIFTDIKLTNMGGRPANDKYCFSSTKKVNKDDNKQKETFKQPKGD